MVKTVDVEIAGIVPLLQHNPEKSITDDQSKRSSGVVDYSGEAEAALYKNAAGIVYMPSVWIEGALKRAAVDFKIPGKNRKTYKNLVLSSLIVDPEEISMQPQKWEVDKRIVKVQTSRILRQRPKFNKWSAQFKIHLTDEQLPTDVVKELLEYAGVKIGVGDYRPKFGRFEVKKFKVLEGCLLMSLKMSDEIPLFLGIEVRCGEVGYGLVW